MSEKRHQINKFAYYQNIMAVEGGTVSHFFFVSSQDRYLWIMISTQIRR